MTRNEPIRGGFLAQHARVLGFGFLLTFVSSLGQTFFIGQFKGSILEAIPGLTHGSYGQWYLVATLSSAACLAYVGRRIDDIDLRGFVIVLPFRARKNVVWRYFSYCLYLRVNM